MNKLVHSFLTTRGTCNSNPSLCRAKGPYCGHDIPQYDFIYGTQALANESNNATVKAEQHQQQPLVRWVLHFENLEAEFSSLMKKYGLHGVVRLPKTVVKLNKGDGEKGGPPHLSAANLTEENLRLIEIVYDKDFQLGNGYRKLTSR